MDAHEVPTHLGAEDRVLLWFTFPQLVALTAVAALAYGVYHVAPLGAEAVRIALGAGFALVGVILIAGRVGGRRLPALIADLLRFGFGPRRFRGPPAQLLRAQPPTSPDATTAAGPEVERTHADAPRAAPSADPVSGARRLARLKPSKRGRRRGERTPFKPRNWFRKRDRRRSKQEFAQARETLAQEQREQQASYWLSRPALLGGLTALALVASVGVCGPPFALADEGEQEEWSSDEIEFEPPPLISGRRLYIERLTVTRGAATVVVKAAANLEVEARAFGGADGRELKFTRTDTLGQGGRTSYLLPLDGPAPAFTFAWRDEYGQAGAVSLSGAQLPYPLPAVAGQLCDLRLQSLSWTPSLLTGAVGSTCVSTLEEPLTLQTVAGQANLSQTALLPATVTALSGTLSVSAGGRQASVPLTANGETRFELALGAGRELLALEIAAALSVDLEIALPPLVQLTHHPHRVEQRTQTVTLTRPGTSQTVSKSVSVPLPNGGSSTHVISATLSIPPAQVQQDVSLQVEHDEHVRAELIERAPLHTSRSEELTLSAGVAADDGYQALVIPDEEPQRTPSVQVLVSGGDLQQLLVLLGWELR